MIKMQNSPKTTKSGKETEDTGAVDLNNSNVSTVATVYMDFSAGITLKGENLGERHRYFNCLVTKSCQTELNFENLPESTPIEKLFKIDVANQHKNVNYILKTLKDDDMLYVSRALKCSWLLDLEHRDVINPVFLETQLFPEMIKPAVNKMKHCIQANLRDHECCKQFYCYYKSDFEESIRYLRNCSPAFIMEMVENVVEKITPRHLKMLCERCPKVGKVYFECLLKNREALSRYLDDQSNYFDSLKCILKTDGNLYLELIETYFNEFVFRRISPDATRYIIKNYKNKFLAKRELYTSQILNVNALASCLSSNECKDLVLHLAKADYLGGWFNYQSVEPLIKRLVPEERADFKKLVFVDKSIVDKVKEWPYQKPSPPKLIDYSDHIFNDNEHDSYEYECYADDSFAFKRLLKKRKYCVGMRSALMADCVKPKTLLDKLFDCYRFVGFSKTYSELKSRLQAESTIEGRQSILLVLVSKTGGIPAQVDVLLKMLVERHKNEPSNLRAAIVRSLVKRVSFWRMPDDVWNLMIEFAHGLGLDGRDGEPLCVEGLHAVILRNVLRNTTPTTDLIEAYRKNFTTFKEYNLNGSEIQQVKKYLPPMLLAWPNEFLDTVAMYKINVNDIAGAVDMLAKAAHGNEELINSLFDKRIARRQLIADTFPLKQFEASYINALRHDVSLLASGETFAAVASKENANHDRFLQSLTIYFGEVNGLASQHLTSLENTFKLKPKLSLVRPISILSPPNAILKRLQDLNSKKSKDNSKLAMAFKDNVHKARPHLNIDEVDWRVVGSKAVGNKVLICRTASLEQYIKSCLKWRTTSVLALRLSLNTSFEVNTFTIIAAKRPKLVINVATSYFFDESRSINPEIWKLVKEIILKYDILTLPRKAIERLKNENKIPKNIEADYWATMYQAFMKVDRAKAMPSLCMLEKMLHKVDKNFLKQLVNDFIAKDFVVKNVINYSNLHKYGIETDQRPDIIENTAMCMYMRIVAKYLLLSTSEKEQYDKIENFLNPLFDRMETLWKDIEDKSYLTECLYSFLLSFKYTDVFVDARYISCMPIFEKLIFLLQKVMPRKEYFDKYVKIYFTLLYYKAISFVLQHDASVLKDENKSNAMNIVGTKLGEYIGGEVQELAKEFFNSIIEIYKEGLKDFLTDYFPYTNSRYQFLATVTRGILKNDNVEAHLVAEYMYEQFRDHWEDADDILDILRNSKYQEVQFFLNANVSGYGCYYYYE